MKKQIQSIIRAIISRQGAIISLWVLFMVAFIILMANMSAQLDKRENSYIHLWAYSISRLTSNSHEELNRMLTDEQIAIPFIMMSDRGDVEGYHLFPQRIIDNERRLERKISRLAANGHYIPITMRDGSRHMLFYGRSTTLLFLTFFPLAQLVAFALLLWLWIVTMRSNTQNEQNRVWIGLAKETAHQLGTPTSSLLGWIEFLKTQPIDQDVVTEMGKDLAHLMKIADRFSKIGSVAPLEPTSINELIGEAVMYFRKRTPRNVELTYNGLAMAPQHALVNPALFEWVIENLLKNALDALQGHGTIDVRLSRDERNLFIDVTDTGRGIPRANREKIFEPGFSTKTRGWGLGLSLSRRVIEEYHKGRIFVAESEVGKGTTMRVVLKSL